MPVSSLSDLGQDVISIILSKLGAADLGRCCRVSRQFRQLANKDEYWFQHIVDANKIVGYGFGNYRTRFINQVCSRKVISSYNELIAKVQKFLDTVTLSPTGNSEFECHIPHEMFLRIKFDYYGYKAPGDKKSYLFVGKLPGNLGFDVSPKPKKSTWQFPGIYSDVTGFLIEDWDPRATEKKSLMDEPELKTLIEGKIQSFEKATCSKKSENSSRYCYAASPKEIKNSSRQYCYYLAGAITIAASAYFAMMG